MPGQDRVIAVDLGGTNIRVAIVSREGKIDQFRSRAAVANEGVEAVLDRIVAMISEAAVHADLGVDTPVGIVAPGPLNPDEGVVYFAPNLPGWHDIPLGKELSDRLERRVVIGNDANCAALGEAMFGAAKHVENLIYLALGTGIGGGIISRGKLIEGKRGLGAEVGHVSIAADGPPCHCGGTGCLEAYSSGWAIARAGEMAVRSNRSERIAKAAGDEPISAEAIAEAARGGDPVARTIFYRAGRALGVGLGGLINLFNPEMVVIGGGLAEVGELLLAPMRDTLPGYTMPDMLADVTIERSALGTDTGIYGAAARAFAFGYAQDIR